MALCQPLVRHFKQMHKHLAPQFDAPNEGRPSHILELLEWVVGLRVRCMTATTV
jgi:hypothetical protein